MLPCVPVVEFFSLQPKIPQIFQIQAHQVLRSLQEEGGIVRHSLANAVISNDLVPDLVVGDKDLGDRMADIDVN